jgi:hypothetical protein
MKTHTRKVRKIVAKKGPKIAVCGMEGLPFLRGARRYHPGRHFGG